MSVTINGDTGVSKVQDGVIVDADIASLSASKLTGLSQPVKRVSRQYLSYIRINTNTETVVHSVSYTPTTSKFILLFSCNLSLHPWDAAGTNTVYRHNLYRDSTSIRSMWNTHITGYYNDGSGPHSYPGLNTSYYGECTAGVPITISLKGSESSTSVLDHSDLDFIFFDIE